MLLRALVYFALIAMMVSAVNAQLPTPRWSIPVGTNDVALSKDDAYVAAASPAEVIQEGISPNSAEVDYVYVGGWLGEDAVTPDQVRVKIPWWSQLTGKGLALYAIMQNFGSPESSGPLWMIDDYKPIIQEGLFKGVALTWQPAYDWDLQGTGEQCIADIVAGKYDDYIRAEARRCRDAGYPIIIRFGHEFNGFWMGWGNDPIKFKQAWVKVVTLFREEGATNVAWYWCANYNDNPSSRKFQQYYPGDEYVDYVGVDVYANNDWGWWADPEKQIGNPSGNVYDTYLNKPYIVGEWGCSSSVSEQQNADWLQKFFNAIEARSRIKAIVHWHGADWKVSSYPAALQVYKTRIADTRYVTDIYTRKDGP